MASGHIGMMGSSLRQLNIVLFTLVLAASYCDSIHVEFVDTQVVQLKPMDHGALSEISNWFGNLHPQKQQSIDLSSEDISIGSLRKTKRSNYGKNMLNMEGEDLKHELYPQKRKKINNIKVKINILKNKLKNAIRKNVTLSPTNPGVPTAHNHIRILTPDQTNINRFGIVIKRKKPESNANKKYSKRTSNKKNKIRRKNKKNPSQNNKIKCTQKLKVKPKQIKRKDNSKSKRTFKENSKKMQNDYYYGYYSGDYYGYYSGDYSGYYSGDGAVGEEYETSGQSGDATDGEVDEEIEACGQSGDGTDGEDEELEPDDRVEMELMEKFLKNLNLTNRVEEKLRKKLKKVLMIIQKGRNGGRNGNGKNYRKGNGNRNGSNINGNGHNNGGNVNGVSGSSPSALYNAPSRNGDGNGGGNGFTNGVHGSDNGSPFASHSAPGQNSNGNEYSNGNDNGFNSDLPSKLYRTPGF